MNVNGLFPSGIFLLSLHESIASLQYFISSNNIVCHLEYPYLGPNHLSTSLKADFLQDINGTFP